MARANAKRTDPHRPGALIPADYRPVMFYSLPSSQDGMPMPSFHVNCELDRRREERDATGKVVNVINGEHDANGRCCIIGLLHVAKVAFAAHGNTGKCTVCGACFIEGEVWCHEPTGEHIHVGHQCAAKYGLMADWSADELARGRQRAATAVAIAREQNAQARAAFLADHHGLAEALAVEHPIIRDIASRFQSACEISDKQVALVLKLAHEARNPQPLQAAVVAPTGKVTFRGRVVSVKVQDSMYGTTLRMTVKVATPDGVWLAWGTAPAALLDATVNHQGALRGTGEGTEVEITATLTAGRDANFAIMKRPHGKVIALACGGEATCTECQRTASAAEHAS